MDDPKHADKMDRLEQERVMEERQGGKQMGDKRRKYKWRREGEEKRPGMEVRWRQEGA